MGRLSGMVTIARALPGQQRAHFRDREQLLEDRDRRVRETVSYAAKHVPYYRDLFATEDVDPREIRSAEDLARLPVVSREDVRADPARFRSEDPGVRDGLTLQSSGTTGLPLELYHDRRTVLLNVAYGERERAIEIAFAGKRLRYTRLYLGSSFQENVDRVRGFMAEKSFRPLRPRYVRGSLTGAAPERGYELIDRVRPDILLGCGSHLETFFRIAAERGGPKHRPKALMYTWDHMSPGGRRLIEETFGIPVISKYSAMEALKVGVVCEQRSGFHLHEDLCHLTIVDREGRQLADGEPGELLLSNLVNRGSVLLNYRIGDLGRISTSICSCGRSTRVLADLEGRTSEYVTLSDGSIVGPLIITTALNAIPGIVRFQLVQVSPMSFELRLVTVDRKAFDDAAAATAADALRQILEGYEVEPVYLDEMPVEDGKKYRPIVLLPNL
jgi:phenylacetate-CoA ligase